MEGLSPKKRVDSAAICASKSLTLVTNPWYTEALLSMPKAPSSPCNLLKLALAFAYCWFTATRCSDNNFNC